MKRLVLAALVAACCNSTAVLAQTQNIAPLARVTAAPTQVVPGQTVILSADDSIDPDDGPQPLSYTWFFEDGLPAATGVEFRHAWSEPGYHQVTLQVSDGITTAQKGVEIAVVPPVATSRSVQSSSIALSPDGKLLAVAVPDANLVNLLSPETGEILDEIAVGDHPETVAFGEDDDLFVTCRDSGELWRIGINSGVGEVVYAGGRPRAVVVSPAASYQVVVSLESEDRVVVLDPKGKHERASFFVRDGPGAIAIASDGGLAWVTQFITRGDAPGAVSVLDLISKQLVKTVFLEHDPGPDTPSSGRGVPNLLYSVAVHPAGEQVWIGGLKSNSRRGLFIEGLGFEATNRARGGMFPIDANTHADLVASRIDINNADTARAIGFSPDGRFSYVLHQGTDSLTVYDMLRVADHDDSDGAVFEHEARIEVGAMPTGIALSEDGSRAWVFAEMDRSIVELDLADPASPVVARISPVLSTGEPLDAKVALGRRLFHSSRSPALSKDGYLACASCHPGGGHDGQNWDLTQYGEGLRNTIDLRGRAGLWHGPLHWSANFDEIQDFENDIVAAFGGLGHLAADGGPHEPLGAANAGRSEELDALAAYVATFKTPPKSPWRKADGELTDKAKRGKEIFEDPVRRCVECHIPGRFTDSDLHAGPADYLLHDVGTLIASSGSRLGTPLTGVDTPTLLGLWDGAPYLHDGRAATLDSVFAEHNPDDAHGITSNLTAAQRSDLAEYLFSLDANDALLPLDNSEPTDLDGKKLDAGPNIENGWLPRSNNGSEVSDLHRATASSDSDARSTCCYVSRDDTSNKRSLSPFFPDFFYLTHRVTR